MCKKAYLLRSYDHATLERRKIDETLTVRSPALVIFGTTVLESFHNCVSAETLTDGLGQRFGYLIARQDPRRHYKDYPVIDTAAIRSAIAPFASSVNGVEAGKVYTLSGAALDFYKAYYRQNADDSLSESYYRRVLWRSIKLAVVFHVLLAKHGTEIDAEDMRYAARATDLFLTDALEVLRLTDASDFLRLLDKTEAWAERRKAAGESISARDLVRGVRGISSTRLAKEILEVL